MPTRSTPCERSWRDVAELPALRGEAATGGAGGTEVPLPPPQGVKTGDFMDARSGTWWAG